MKRYLLIMALLAFLLDACGPTYVVQQPAPAPAPAPPPPPEITYQTFYDDLSPYGQWIQDPGYGYVWMPDVSPDFKPYSTNGYWVYTDEGWTWNSNYPWGWAAFHYGRWFYQDGYGWMWMPGLQWAPAWVSWRNSPDYYGWAPLGPDISISVSVGGGYNPPPHYWCFVPHQYVASPEAHNYYVSESQNTTIIEHTTVINNVTVINNNRTVVNNNGRAYAGGPDPAEAGRYRGEPLRPVAIRETSNPGAQGNAGGGVAIYRPRVNTATGGGTNPPPPAHVQTLNTVRPVNTTRYQPPAHQAAPANNPTPPANNPQPPPAMRSFNAPNGNNQANNNPPPASATPMSRPAGTPPPARPAGTTPMVRPVNTQPPATPVNTTTTNAVRPAASHPANNNPPKPANKPPKPAPKPPSQGHPHDDQHRDDNAHDDGKGH